MIPSPSIARLAACALLAASTAAAAFCEFEPLRVAENVYAFPGAAGEAALDNCAHTGNRGFIVGASGIVAIDAPATVQLAERMIAAIAKVSAKPIVLLVNTRAAPDRVLGNGAFARRGVPILAQRDTGRLMRERCQTCIHNLEVLLGAAAVQGTAIVPPTREIDASLTLEAGGRTLDIIYPGWGVSPDNVAVLDRASGVLFAGDLVLARRVPELRDARLDGWLAALERLAQSGAQRVVPGQGPVSGTPAIVETVAYLRALAADVRKNYDAGRSLLETSHAVVLPGYRAWTLYELHHPRNVRYLYLRLEEEDFARR